MKIVQRNLFALHTQKFASEKIFVLQKCAFVFLWNLHLCFCANCKICIWKNICAADLRILCTDGFCTFVRFVHLCFAHLTKLCADVKTFCEHARVCENVLQKCAHMKFSFFQICARILSFSQKVSKCRKSRNFRKCPENVRKKLTCSWVVHEWFLGQRVWQHRVAKVARICIN